MTIHLYDDNIPYDYEFCEYDGATVALPPRVGFALVGRSADAVIRDIIRLRVRVEEDITVAGDDEALMLALLAA